MGAMLMASGTAGSFEWRDLWQTPEQRAARQRAEQRSDELIEQAPDDQWRGHGYYQKGEFDKAAETFDQAAKAAPSETEADVATYNQATSLVRQGEYDAAIEKYEELLKRNPDHKDAEHNRDIARKLQELTESPQNQDGQSGDQDESGNQKQNGQPQSQQGNQGQQSNQNQQGDSSSSQSSAEQNQSGGQSSEENAEVDVESSSEEAAAAAEEALRQASASEGSSGDEPAQARLSNETMTEGAQATEQWLRQIEDDPAGLLRRKLELSHQQQYPGVGNSEQPW